MTKWCGDFIGEVVRRCSALLVLRREGGGEEVMVRRCSALLVLGLGEGMRGGESGGGDLFGGKNFGGRGFIIGGNVVTLW